MSKGVKSLDFAESVRQYRGTVFRVALNFVKNVHDADDIAQEVFLKLYNLEKDFPTCEQEKAWLIRVAVNQSKNFLKTAWRRNRADLDESIPASRGADSDLLGYVNRLKPKYRAVIYLHYYEGYSAKEIAALMKINLSAVTTQLKRAREQLKETITKEEHYYGARLQRNI